MNREPASQGTRRDAPRYECEAWRTDETSQPSERQPRPHTGTFDTVDRDPRELTRLFQLLGLINYKILTGNKVYVEVGGTVYKTLYGCYWRSVFTGVEHYLLRCQEISAGMWSEGSAAVSLIDLPISHTKEGWTAEGHSIMFMLNRD